METNSGIQNKRFVQFVTDQIDASVFKLIFITGLEPSTVLFKHHHVIHRTTVTRYDDTRVLDSNVIHYPSVLIMVVAISK